MPPSEDHAFILQEAILSEGQLSDAVDWKIAAAVSVVRAGCEFVRISVCAMRVR